MRDDGPPHSYSSPRAQPAGRRACSPGIAVIAGMRAPSCPWSPVSSVATVTHSKFSSRTSKRSRITRMTEHVLQALSGVRTRSFDDVWDDDACGAPKYVMAQNRHDLDLSVIESPHIHGNTWSYCAGGRASLWTQPWPKRTPVHIIFNRNEKCTHTVSPA